MPYTKEDMSFNDDQASLSGEQLPAYAETMKGHSPIEVTEKEAQRECQDQRSSSKMSTLKSILSGDVHKHNPRLALDRSLDQQMRSSRPSSKPKSTSSSSSSTLKSILTGEVHKHHPMYRLEESVDPSVRRR
jgi:hypothetical protein